MIVTDSSPLIAIIKDEDDADTYLSALSASDRVVLGAPNKLEVMMVAIGHYGPIGRDVAQKLIRTTGIEIAELNDDLVDIATDAFMRFGRGRGHPAKLNFGDCMAYALAKSLDAPLLYKGDDFSKTDIRSVR